MYIFPVLNGIWQGFVISIVLFGPAFFKLIHTSIQDGFKKGVLLASGVFLSDLLVAIGCILGLAKFMEDPGFQKMYSLSAGVVMLLLGLKYFRHQYKAFLVSYTARVPHHQSVFRGFWLNLINPFTFILWINVMGSISLKYAGEPEFKTLLTINLITILFVLFMMDILKVFLSHLVGRKLNSKIFFIINKYFGILLIVIGLIFLFRFVSLMMG
jgi:threonine/homoserine/homoserine lactone efflux protein